MSGRHDLRRLNEVLFKELEEVVHLDVKDKNFRERKAKAELTFSIADRIIKTQSLELQNQVWQTTRRYGYNSKMESLDVGMETQAIEMVDY